MSNIVYRQNDNLLELTGLINEATGAAINDAQVSARLVDAKGVDIPGQGWPLTLEFVVGSDGDYRGMLESALQLDGRLVTAIVDVDAGQGLTAHIERELHVRDRTS